MSHKQLKIQTITPRYDVIEDRIRLTLNYKASQDRMDFMLTRKFILKLLPGYEEYLLKVYYEEMQKTKHTTISKNKNTRLNDHSTLEEYQRKAELLLGTQFSFISKNKLTLLKLQSQHSEATATLTYEDLSNLVEVIKSAIPYFDWGVSPHL